MREIIPTDLKYTKTHEWLKQEQNDYLMGITAHAQELLGDMVYVELPRVGRQVTAGEDIAVVESVKAASDVYAPISGTVIAVNEQLNATPELINQDPYASGWILKIQADSTSANVETEMAKLLTSSQYSTLAAEQ